MPVSFLHPFTFFLGDGKCICFALSPKANVWESYKRNKGRVALLAYISHHLNVLSPILANAVTDAQQAQNMTYPSSNTIKSCICFTWRLWLVDPSVWNSQREALSAWETQMNKKSNLSKNSNNSNDQHSHCFLCWCFPTHSANGETASKSHIKSFLHSNYIA